MKIYTKVTMDMETLAIIEEESFEYSGPVAECKGGSPQVQYQQSPEARAITEAFIPLAQQTAQAGRAGDPLWQVGAPPTPGTPPSAAGMLPRPTSEMFASIAPEYKQALWQPYEEIGQGLVERLGSFGQMGSQRGGASGAAGAALGQFAAKAAPAYTQQLYNVMAQPMAAEAQADYQAQMGVFGREQDLSAEQWRLINQSRSAPFQMMPGMLGGAMPTGVAQQQGGGFSGTGALMGGIGASMLPFAAGSPWMWPAIGAGALLGGFFA